MIDRPEPRRFPPDELQRRKGTRILALSIIDRRQER
jgi:hypothetical protein